MSSSNVITEDGVVVGNVTDKYAATNPIHRILMGNFLRHADAFVDAVDPKAVHEVGCGEGHLSSRWVAPGRTIRGTDFSEHCIEVARRSAQERGLDIDYQVQSVYELDPQADSAELVVCCEVLEHLEDPDGAMQMLGRLADPYLLVSVPREPIWRALNMARGKYLGALGNTPGHLQHWSTDGFVAMLHRHVDVLAVVTPLPWTMALCRTHV